MEDYGLDNEEEDVSLYNEDEDSLFEDLDEDTLTFLDLLDEGYDNEDDFEDDWSDLEFDLDFEDDSSTGSDPNNIQSLFAPKIKSSSVNYDAVNNRLKSYLASLPSDLRDKVVVTSGKDGTHAKNSKHYLGNAVDLRFDKTLHNYIEGTARNYGLKTMNPFHGTAPHTHLEVMQMGGFAQAPLSPLAHRQPTLYKPSFNIDYLDDRFTHDASTIASQGQAALNAPSVTDLVSTGMGVANGINSGLEAVQEIRRKTNKVIYETANAGIDSAINILGQNQQNQELRRISKLRSDASKKYQSYTPQIKNIPIYT